MKKKVVFLILFLAEVGLCAQSVFKGEFVNKSDNLSLVLDLNTESVYVPGMSFIGPTYGYLAGDVYGIWMVTSAQIKDVRNAVIRLSNDQGADTQEVELTLKDDSLLHFKANGKMHIKRVEKKKLVKLATTFDFRRK